MSATFDVTVHKPWLYTIACVRDRLLYIGETHDRGGLISRLGSHFGYHNSSLRHAASEYGGVRLLKPPFVVVAAELPADEPIVRFDCSSKSVRLLVEALVHHRLGQFATHDQWTVISSTQASSSRENADIVKASESIADGVQSTLKFIEGLSTVSPFHFVSLGWQTDRQLEHEDLGRTLNRIEVMLCQFVLDALRKEFGERWWTEGVPLPTRRACADRQEEEGQELPKEAYLMLIDLRKIVESNWPIFQHRMQQLSEKSGKQRATAWIGELNELRKYWAHPIKQIYADPVSSELQQRVRMISIELHSIVREDHLPA